MQSLQPNTLLQGGRYKILSTLGQGGFGITYLAMQSGLERKVAIKEFFMKELCDRDESTSHVTLGTSGSRETVNRFREKFLKEARNIARLNHPNIVRIIDVFEENGTAYYVMEYAGSQSLAETIKQKGCLAEPVAKRYILQVADALKYIHRLKMNHLDVKPANIMINEKDEAVLIDFGLSKQYDASTGKQTSTTPVGISEGYAPMEQYKQGGVGEFSPETDIYALAATYFKLLTGTTPPSASDIYEDGVPVEELKAKGVSQAAIDTICKAMEGRKKDRMHNVSTFIERLQDITNTVAIHKTAKTTNRSALTNIETKEETVLLADAPQPDLPDKTFTVDNVSFTMKPVIGGTFTMGATSEQGSDAYDDEKPAHQVTLSSYYIGETEVTQALWQAIMGSNPSRFKGSNLPVEQVSWNDCQEFITKLNAMTGQKFRLPTEAEWEYAARGGNKSKGYKYSGSNNIDDVAWYYGNSGSNTHAVKTKQPNELGIYDMSGNVWEWCSDWMGSYSSNAQTNPTGPSTGSNRVYRGGSWHSFAGYCRVSYRNFDAPDDRSYLLGLRLALDVQK